MELPSLFCVAVRKLVQRTIVRLHYCKVIEESREEAKSRGNSYCFSSGFECSSLRVEQRGISASHNTRWRNTQWRRVKLREARTDLPRPG